MKPIGEKREWLGKLVRMEWVKWASEQNNPKPSWLVPWDQLDESSKEVDRRIGEFVADQCVPPELLCAQKHSEELEVQLILTNRRIKELERQLDNALRNENEAWKAVMEYKRKEIGWRMGE